MHTWSVLSAQSLVLTVWWCNYITQTQEDPDRLMVVKSKTCLLLSRLSLKLQGTYSNAWKTCTLLFFSSWFSPILTHTRQKAYQLKILNQINFLHLLLNIRMCFWGLIALGNIFLLSYFAKSINCQTDESDEPYLEPIYSKCCSFIPMIVFAKGRASVDETNYNTYGSQAWKREMRRAKDRVKRKEESILTLS